MEEQIGSYKILRKIGAGGMAQVFLAVHKDVPSLKVILKVLGDPRMGDRFLQEADKLALLDGHPSICQIKHFFNHGDNTVIAMEYIEGVTLEDKITAAGRLPVSEAVAIASDVLEVLDFAHAKGICHRDIKPGNIMIDNKGRVRIIDFGIAKGANDPNLTTAGTACGTPSYMAPEQFNPEADTDYALVDIYAVGTTLYMMLAGELPFKGDNAFALRDLKLFSDARSVRSLNPEVPKVVDQIVLKSLSRDPSGRFESAAEMRQALLAAKVDKPTASPKPVDADAKTVAFRTGETPTRPRSRTPLFAALGVVAIVGIALIGWKLLGSSEKTSSTPPATTAPDTTAAAVEPVTPPVGRLTLAANMPSDFYLDDSLIAQNASEIALSVDTGARTVRVTHTGAVTPDRYDTVTVTPGDDITRNYAFALPEPPEPKPAESVQPASVKPAKAKTGAVRIGSSPQGADIYIDGELQKQKTAYSYDLEPGRHIIRVVIEWDGRELSREQTLEVVADSIHKVSFDLLE